MYRIERATQRRKDRPDVAWALCQSDRASEIFERALYLEPNLPDKSVVRYPGGPNDGWSDVESLQAAVKLGIYGWREGEKLIHEKMEQGLVTQRALPRKTQGLEVAGAYPLVPAAIAGDPMCMFTPDAQSIKTKPVVRIVVNVAVSGNVPRATIQARGAAILSWVDELEASGYRCEIAIVETGLFGANSPSPKGVLFSATGKLPEEPLDVDRMSYLLCHPSVQRRIFFAMYEGEERLRSELGLTAAQAMTYGQPTDDILPEWIGDHSVYFPSIRKAQGDWANPAFAVAAVERMILKGLQLGEVRADADQADQDDEGDD